MASLYLTHCTYKKDESLNGTRKKVAPDKLYTGDKITRFINHCKTFGASLFTKVLMAASKSNKSL
jgi:hypothetical protein